MDRIQIVIKAFLLTALIVAGALAFSWLVTPHLAKFLEGLDAIEALERAEGEVDR